MKSAVKTIFWHAVKTVKYNMILNNCHIITYLQLWAHIYSKCLTTTDKTLKHTAQLSHKYFSQNPKHLTKITLHLCVSLLNIMDF